MDAETKKFKKPTANPRPALGNIINKGREPQGVEVSFILQLDLLLSVFFQKKPHVLAEVKPSHHEAEETTLSPEAMDMAEAFSELHIDDIDTNDFDNPQLCAEYVKDIYKYIREQEVFFLSRDTQ